MVFSRPPFGLAEIAWRWSFGFAAVLLLAFSGIEYLDSLPVTSRDELLFRTRQPALISRALSHILRGSSLRLIAAMALLAMALSVAWILLSSMGRAATVKAILNFFGQSERPTAPFRWSSLIGLNFLRVAATLAAAVGCVAAFLLGSAASPADDPSPASAVLIGIFIVMLIALAWSTLNWFLSLSAVFVVAQGRDTFGAIAAAVGLCRDHTYPILAANTWFGLAHLLVFFIASSVVAFPVAFAGLLPAALVLEGMLLVALLYFAAADFLYVGRLAAHIAILVDPQAPPPSVEVARPSSDGGLGLSPPTAGIDRTELILSDLPNLASEA